MTKFQCKIIVTLFISIASFYLITTFPKKALSKEKKYPKGDGIISFYNYHLNESLKIKYKERGKYNKSALKKINKILRSRLDDKIISVDIRLIELMDHIQDHFKIDTVEIISGYRSPELNLKLKKEGKNVAGESLHLKGKAVDIHIDEITEEALRDYVKSLKAGGIGFYPANDFIHIDLGAVRYWQSPDVLDRQLIGFKKSPSWRMITDQNIYFKDDGIKLTITNITDSPKKILSPLILQFFRRGKWTEVREFKNVEGKIVPAKDNITISWLSDKKKIFGKFRFILNENPKRRHIISISNEFYRKRF